jgi:hypothetical protein
METPTVCLYVDSQNVKLSQSEAQTLLRFVNAIGQLLRKNLYYNSQCHDQNSAKKVWESCGLICIDVPCRLKNSADNQLFVDCIDDNSKLSPNLVVIVSGDGDFLSLVDTLQKLNKTVIVIARKGNVKQKLIENADRFYFIDELPDLTDGNHIVYENAVQCLIEAIKNATSRGQHTTFSAIDQLMREDQNFPKYQGVSSIYKKNGKKFTHFSKFIHAVAQDNLVCVQNSGKFQEVQLLNANQCAA